MKNQYQVRQARPSEAEEMTHLSFRSKAYWGYPEEWIELWRKDLSVTSEMLEKYIAFVVECDGQIVGFWCRDPVQSEEVSHGLLFIEPNHMGKGCAKMLLKQSRKNP